MRAFIANSFCAAVLIFGSAAAQADVVFDETVDSDLSNDYLNPNVVNLPFGTSSILGSTGVDQNNAIDFDYFRITLTGGKTLEQIILADQSGDGSSFIAVHVGDTFSFNPGVNDSECLNSCLGWAHFGPNETANGGGVGEDILPLMASNTTAFTPPLTGTSYAFWIQDNDEESHYRFDFVVAPEPATWCFVAIGGLVALALKRRRQ
jgi:hypothetical protein